MKKLDTLPVFPRRDLPEYDLVTWRLVVDGLVHNRMDLPYDALIELPRVGLRADFTCVEGWTVEDIAWEGVRVRTLAERAGASPQVKFVTFHAPNGFAVSLPLDEAMKDETVLAYRMNGAPLPQEHGAPLRLVSPAKDCWFGVKWVERVEFSETNAHDTGRDIALGRVAAKRANDETGK